MDIAAFWVAHRVRFVAEARRSALSLRRHHDDIERVLFTPDNETAGEAFDRVVAVPKATGPWFLDSVRYFNHALDHLPDLVLYLDTDTHVCERLDDLLAVLDRFDFAAAHAPGRRTAATVGTISPAFPEVNVGVLAFRNNAAVRALFSDWLARYQTNREMYGNNDQAPLREALWQWDGRLYVFPPEWNMRWQFGGFARYGVKVLHGRGADGGTCGKVNWKKEMRGWDRGRF